MLHTQPETAERSKRREKESNRVVALAHGEIEEKQKQGKFNGGVHGCSNQGQPCPKTVTHSFRGFCSIVGLQISLEGLFARFEKVHDEACEVCDVARGLNQDRLGSLKAWASPNIMDRVSAHHILYPYPSHSQQSASATLYLLGLERFPNFSARGGAGYCGSVSSDWCAFT